MITTTESVAWEFGGLLHGLAPDVAWPVLGVGAVIGVGLVYWSYRRALVSLSWPRCLALCTLRLAVWLGLLLILAAPTRVIRRHEARPTKPLAVLVDRSGSMTTADNRQRRRLDDSLIRWRAMEPTARAAFGPPKFFAFTDTTSAMSTVDATPALKGEQTRLFAALRRTLAEPPQGGWGGVVVLTDGLDTSGESLEAESEVVARAALGSGTPLYFVPGRNRYAGGTYFSLRDFSAPAQTAPRSTFRVEATFDSFQTAPRDFTLKFKINGVERRAASLHVESGRRLATWSADVQADAPGVLELELQAGTEIARTAVRVELPSSNRILYFQGALDWSYRFLADILKRDASFTLTPVFNFPNPNAVLPPGSLARLPTTEAEFAGYDILILANAVATQFTTAQQTALDQWVRNGGVLLFLTPDDDSTQGFVGSELEKMLPVTFVRTAKDSRLNSLGIRMRSGGLGGGSDATNLIPYAWEPIPQVAEIFAMSGKKEGEIPKPLFSSYAHVAAAKPGAEVLARHPTDNAPGGDERAILLALQRYGRGRSGVLTTDSLWRWKLNQPTSERGVEIFWQNLFAWLSRDRQRGLAFDHAPLHAPLGREVALRLVGGGSEPLKVEAVLGNERVRITESTPDGGTRVFAWRPTKEGFWQIEATGTAGRAAKHWLSVDHAAQTGEFSGLPPDEELLRALANPTGGAVLENSPPAAWQEAQSDDGELLAEQKTPLWHQAWIFGALLGLYGLELLLRRWWKML